ncbi:cytokine receptor [Drosophila kikkawai]|uniref:Cytokine receptor n=1 Tax=Drosophila kikkawai TaxID=30033 RepID=A0A6P4JGV6_DROKI|nr:cytokine receptor isoform X2 [Drosophila kikkawai]
MGWLTWCLILKLMLLVLTTARADDSESEPCELEVWASGKGKWSVGRPGQVFCACIDRNSSEVHRLSLYQGGTKLNTTIVNNTVQYTKESATECVQNEYECKWNTLVRGSVIVTAIAALNVTDFACRFDVSDKLNCSFSRSQIEQLNENGVRYQLQLPATSYEPSGSTSQCTTADRRVNCILELRMGHASKMSSQIFNLTRYSNNAGKQTQLIELPFDSMFVPKCRPSEADKITKDNQTCLRWYYPGDMLERSSSLEWVVELKPRLAQIKPPPLILTSGEQPDLNSLTFCFPHPEQGHQVFDVRLRCHIKGNNTIWSENYPEFEITTNDTLPARPPQFVPNGFTYDEDKNELTVFWLPLDEIEYNGPNLKYDVRWKGQEASRTYTRSAIFTNWDDSQPANVTMRSRNIKGASVNSTWLWVPALSNVAKRRATHLRYIPEENSTTISWKKPEDTDLLSGYLIYWCNASRTLGQLCDDRVSIKNISLDDKEQQEYRFDTSMPLQDIALEPIYHDHVSGGMSVRLEAVEKKENYSFNLRIVEGICALLVLGVIVMSAKKLRKMNDIKVEMPEMGPIFTSEPKSDSKPSPLWGVPIINYPYYNPKTTILNLDLVTFTDKGQESEPEEKEMEESFTGDVAQPKPESSAYVCMDNAIGKNGDIRPPSNGYVMAPPPQIDVNINGYVVASPPRLIPNNEGYINPPPPRLNPDINGYVTAPQPRSVPNNNGYVDSPPPRLIPNSDGYINPPPPHS